MAFAVFLQKLQDELGILAHVLLISIIAVDENHQMGRVNGHLCAFVVAGRSSHTANLVPVNWKTFDIDYTSADTFVRFVCLPDT